MCEGTFDFIISDIFKAKVDAVFLLPAVCFLSIKGSSASGQVGSYGAAIHPRASSIKTNLHCSVGH